MLRVLKIGNVIVCCAAAIRYKLGNISMFVGATYFEKNLILHANTMC